MVPPRNRRVVLIALGAWSLAFWAARLSVPSPRAAETDGLALNASGRMARAIEALRDCREALGIPIDVRADPNRTGLIGVEDSIITTSLGQIEAKRTSTNPNFAGVLVRLFREAGVRRGDTVAVGASSSFPGLILAALAAAEAMDLRPLLISSLGASNWGANIPGWTWLEISDCLGKAGLIDVRPLAFSVGGEGDEGLDMSAEGREFLRSKAVRSEVPLILEADLAGDVRRRMEIFERAAAGAPIKAFVNVGGSWVNMGTDAGVLALTPGLNATMAIPPANRRGLIQEMASRGIPVIHLLFVKGLAERFGLPWDPVPLPGPGENALPDTRGRGFAEAAISIAYLAGLFLGVGWLAIRSGAELV
jgi:poly-gamma-glutamate system protein